MTAVAEEWVGFFGFFLQIAFMSRVTGSVTVELRMNHGLRAPGWVLDSICIALRMGKIWWQPFENCFATLERKGKGDRSTFVCVCGVCIAEHSIGGKENGGHLEIAPKRS